MALVIITIEDTYNGKVSATSDPSFEEMIKFHAAGEGLQPSHGYALHALNSIREAAKTGKPFEAIVKKAKGG